MCVVYFCLQTVLLEKGANVHAKNIAGDMAILFAASRGHVEIVDLLLENGADVDVKNKGGIGRRTCK